MNQTFSKLILSENSWIGYNAIANTLTMLYFCEMGCAQCDMVQKCYKCEPNYTFERGKCRLIDNCLIYSEKNPQNSEFPVCQQYCHRKCIACVGEMDACTVCTPPFEMNAAGKCELPRLYQNLGLIYGSLFLLRSTRFRMVFLLVDNFELYEFHRQDYEGVLADVFRTCREVKSVSWRMVSL